MIITHASLNKIAEVIKDTDVSFFYKAACVLVMMETNTIYRVVIINTISKSRMSLILSHFFINTILIERQCKKSFNK